MKKNIFKKFIDHCNKVSEKKINFNKSPELKKVNFSEANKKVEGLNSFLDQMLKKNLN